MLAQMIRDASHDNVEHRNPYVTAVEGCIGVFTHTQEPGQPLDDYQTRFKAQVDQVRAHQGQPWRHPKLIDHERKRKENEGKGEEDLAEIADEGFLATLFIILSDPERFAEAKETLNNDFMRKMDTYPKTLQAAYSYLKNFQGKKRAKPAPVPQDTGVACVAARVMGVVETTS